MKYSLLGLIGSAISAFCGAGPGAIIVPVLINFGIDPRVSIATAMYLGVLTTGTSSILVFFFQMIRLDYALWVSIMTAFGTIPGMYMQYKYVNKTSYHILIVTLCFLMIVVAMMLINIPQLYQLNAIGEDIYKFKNWCTVKPN